jgi:Protein of unknown function (DUF2397)
MAAPGMTLSTVAEYIRSRSRHQVSKLGGRLHREAVAILHASDGAREVARELLGQIVQSLERILAMLDRREIDADALAGEVTTVFGNQRLFTDSVRDFYACLAGILSRHDLAARSTRSSRNCCWCTSTSSCPMSTGTLPQSPTG